MKKASNVVCKEDRKAMTTSVTFVLGSLLMI
jgi:hypothetical protein